MSAQLSYPSLKPVKGSVAATAGRRLWTGIGSMLRAACERNRSRRMLAELDDRLLRDVGLTRDEAVAEFRKSFWA
ncbi:MAG: DUF1127 domain-containing protein [Rhodospirillales bacterium]